MTQPSFDFDRTTFSAPVAEVVREQGMRKASAYRQELLRLAQAVARAEAICNGRVTMDDVQQRQALAMPRVRKWNLGDTGRRKEKMFEMR